MGAKYLLMHISILFRRVLVLGIQPRLKHINEYCIVVRTVKRKDTTI